MAREPLVTSEWLADHLGEPDLRILDASWHMPATGRDAREEFRAGHIPGAAFFDIDKISDPDSPLPHMAPPPDEFARQMRGLGVDNGSLCVVYDSVGLWSAPRVWWMLRAVGHEKVFVLDGGLPKWRREGRPMEAAAPPPRAAHFTSQARPALVRGIDQVKKALASGDEQVVDARAAERFRGESPEPRPGLRSGHMPGSVNLPWTALVADGVLKPAAELEAIFRNAGVDVEKPVICSCGSGVSAAILALGLARLGHEAAIYDGSWTEWAVRGDLPIATGS